MDNLDIPDFLQIDAETRHAAWRGVRVKAAPSTKLTTRDVSEMLRQHRLRKLRAEERRLSKLIDQLGDRNNAARRRLYATIKEVEDEIRDIS